MRIWAGRRVSPRRRTLWDKLLSRHNWRGLAGMLRTADAPLAVMFRYYLKVGNYPYTIGLYTPLGRVAITLYDWEDLVTVHEVFFREDYAIGRGVRTIVDFGSNIGVSAIYFLTRNPGVKVYAYEPVPRNKCRLERNLAPFAGRVELIDCAVGTEEGTVTFGIERSGRYGGILRQDEADAGRRPFEAYIQVPCRYAERELARILAAEGVIDVLKIDVEGMEVPILASLSPHILSRIACVMAECNGRDVALPNFRYRQELSIARFTAQHP